MQEPAPLRLEDSSSEATTKPEVAELCTCKSADRAALVGNCLSAELPRATCSERSQLEADGDTLPLSSTASLPRSGSTKMQSSPPRGVLNTALSTTCSSTQLVSQPLAVAEATIASTSTVGGRKDFPPIVYCCM